MRILVISVVLCFCWLIATCTVPDTTFIISLPRHVARRSQLLEQLGPGRTYWLFDGVDIQEQTPISFARYMRVNWIGQRIFETLGNQTGPVQVAASLAHMHVWLEIYSRGLPSAVVLEDDAWLEPDFWTTLQHHMASIPPDFDIIHLGFLNVEHLCPVDILFVDKTEPVLKSNGSMCHHAYIVSQRFVRRFFGTPASAVPVDNVLDVWVHQLIGSHYLNAYVMADQLAGQQPSTKSIIGNATVGQFTWVSAQEAHSLVSTLTWNEASSRILAFHDRSFHEMTTPAAIAQLNDVGPATTMTAITRNRHLRDFFLLVPELNCLDFEHGSAPLRAAIQYADGNQPALSAAALMKAGAEFSAHIETARCARLTYFAAGRFFWHVNDDSQAATAFREGLRYNVAAFVQVALGAALRTGLQTEIAFTVREVIAQTLVKHSDVSARVQMLLSVSRQLSSDVALPQSYHAGFEDVRACLLRCALQQAVQSRDSELAMQVAASLLALKAWRCDRIMLVVKCDTPEL
eukprot:TRINITY_DN1884_c0_g1_i4.p1 TRINITY_DN1884_c0_g1~~TRINITY_DN1884_c0_g1_i4.p1  ORF type:complete len:517 (+),score=93.19 TRINITY_DN1884_c0_g1_i4:71-1621(+)